MKKPLTIIMSACLTVFGLQAYADNDTLTATTHDCINAKKHCMLEVVPPTASSNPILFKVKQVCTGSFEFNYEFLMEDQIANRKFLGRKLCDGVLSYSDMDLPFFKNNDIKDANDGLLVIDILDKSSGDINARLNQMEKIANDASTGSYSPGQLQNLDDEFQSLLSEVNRVATVTNVNGISLLDGSTDSLTVMLNQSHQSVTIPLANFTTGSGGLNISTLDVLKVKHAKKSVSLIQAAEQQVKQALQGFDQPKPILEAGAKADATITLIDLNGPQFAITKIKPHHLTE